MSDYIKKCEDGQYEVNLSQMGDVSFTSENASEQWYGSILSGQGNCNSVSLKQKSFQGNVQIPQRGSQSEIEKAQMEIYKKMDLSQIKIAETEAKEKIKSDIAGRRELQITNVIMQKGKTIRVVKEQFGSDIDGNLPLGFVESKIFISYGGKIENGLLYGLFTNELGREKNLFFNL